MGGGGQRKEQSKRNAARNRVVNPVVVDTSGCSLLKISLDQSRCAFLGWLAHRKHRGRCKPVQTGGSISGVFAARLAIPLDTLVSLPRKIKNKRETKAVVIRYARDAREMPDESYFLIL